MGPRLVLGGGLVVSGLGIGAMSAISAPWHAVLLYGVVYALGYPTANIRLANYLRPRFGIYAVRGRVPGLERPLDGVASLGIRPMFEPAEEWLEPFFFDFDGDLYGRTVEVQLISFLRDEQLFDGIEPLKAQMARDEEEARRRLGS